MPIRIHERLRNVYGDATVDVSTIRRWVRRYKEAEGHTRLADETRSGRPATAVTPGNIQRVDDWAGIHTLVKRWTKTVEMDGDYIEK